MFDIRFGSLIAGVALVSSEALLASAHTIDILGDRRAEGVVLIKITAEGVSDERAVYLDVKAPGDEYYTAMDLIRPGDPALRGALFSEPEGGVRVLLFPAILMNAKSIETAKHPFSASGPYSIRLKTYDTSVSPPEEEILFETDVKFADKAQADRDYFALARRQELWRLWGMDNDYGEELAGAHESLVGIALVAHIVNVTYSSTPTQGKRGWDQILYDLALAVPDSSYAPYVAYYAGCSFLEGRKRIYLKTTYGYDLPDKRITELDYYKKAHRAFEFAVERGDPYIQPLAMCCLAALKAWGEDFPGAAKLIERAKAQSNNGLRVGKTVADVERHVADLERRLRERQESNGA